MRPAAVATLALFAVALVACDKTLLGLPRVPLSVLSPDGRSVASVRNHVTIDPPDQSVWLDSNGETTRLRRLGPDSDWCDTIVWSADSSTVAFLVQGARLITADRASHHVVSEKWLTDWRGEYPPYRAARDLRLSEDGREARYRDCGQAPVRFTQPGCVDRVMLVR